MILREILEAKGNYVHVIGPLATLDDVVAALVEHNVGSLVVVADPSSRMPHQVLGIISERDFLRAYATGTPLAKIHVRDVMSRDLIIGRMDSEVQEIMGLMTEHRIRHLPVLEEGELRGIISIGDIVKAQHDQLSMENHYLKTYIQS